MTGRSASWAAPWVDGEVPGRLPGAAAVGVLVEATSEAVLVRVPSVGRFLARAGDPVVVARRAGATDADVRCFVEGPAVTASWLLSGRFALRGAAVDVGGTGVVLTGEPASGASSLAAALALRGHAVVADRLVEVDGAGGDGPLTVAVRDTAVQLWPPHHRLVDDPVRLGPGEVIRPALAKRRHRLGPPARPVPLGLVVVLVRRTVPRIEVADLGGVEGVAALQMVQWHHEAAFPAGRAAPALTWLARVAGSAALRRLTVPRFGPLGAVADRIEELTAGRATTARTGREPVG